MKPVIICPENFNKLALADLVRGMCLPSIWWGISVHEIKQRFRRSLLGPFWLTLSLAIMIATLGFLGGRLLNKSPQEVLPMLTVGLIFWTLFSDIISDGTKMFMGAKSYIQDVPLPISIHLYRVLAKSIIVCGHHMIIYVGMFVFFFPLGKLYNMLLFPLGLCLFVVSTASLAMVLGILSARFRDIPQVISSILRILFFGTPIFWTVDPLNRPKFVTWNPLHHLIEVVRAPLLGQSPDGFSWSFSVVTMLICAVTAFYLYRKFYSRIPYWI